MINTNLNMHSTLQDWAKSLLATISEMGNRQTNPVLLTLGKTKKINPFQHYPEKAYCFGNNYWRAYYHCHHAPLNLEQEHGHLHFFTRNSNNGDWAHCFALSMNNFGQPVYMFTTNQWVTLGEWLDADNLAEALFQLAEDTTDSLVLDWFKYFILLYQHDIKALLEKRDSAVTVYCDGNIKNCNEDRNLYQFSILPVNLQNKLGSLLVKQQTNKQTKPVNVNLARKHSYET